MTIQHARLISRLPDMETLFSLPVFVRFLKHHKLGLGVAALLGAVVGGFYAWSKPDIYISRAIIMPRSDSGNKALAAVMGQLGNMPGVGSLVGGMNANQETTQFQILLRTDVMASKVLEVGDLRTSFDVDKIRKNFSIRVDGPAIHLQFRSTEPALATKVVEAYLLALQSFLNTNIVTQSRNTEVFVGERLGELTKQVDQAESHLAALRMGLVRPSSGRSIQSEILRAEREFQRLVKLSELLSQQYELSRIEAKREDPMFLLVEPPQVPLRPSGPFRLLLTFGLAMSSCLGMLFFLICRRKWQDLMQEERESRGFMNSEVLRPDQPRHLEV